MGRNANVSYYLKKRRDVFNLRLLGSSILLLHQNMTYIVASTKLMDLLGRNHVEDLIHSILFGFCVHREQEADHVLKLESYKHRDIAATNKPLIGSTSKSRTVKGSNRELQRLPIAFCRPKARDHDKHCRKLVHTCSAAAHQPRGISTWCDEQGQYQTP